jgi:O-antigen/teichoic acid export membrane protein
MLNWTLIPAFGYVGAAWATLISGGVFAVLYLMVSQRFYLIPFRWRQIFFSVLLTVAIAYLGNFIAGSLVIKVLQLVVVCGGILSFELISREDLTACWGAFRSVCKKSAGR